MDMIPPELSPLSLALSVALSPSCLAT
jgi:hypothetical protein